MACAVAHCLVSCDACITSWVCVGIWCQQCYQTLFSSVSMAQEGTMWCLLSGTSDMRGGTICSNFWWFVRLTFLKHVTSYLTRPSLHWCTLIASKTVLPYMLYRFENRQRSRLALVKVCVVLYNIACGQLWLMSSLGFCSCSAQQRAHAVVEYSCTSYDTLMRYL